MEAIRLNCNMHLAKIDYTQIHSPFTEIYCRRLYSWAIILSLLFQCGYNCGLTPQKKNLNRRPTLQLRIGANIFLLLKSEGSLCYSTLWRSHCSPSLSFTKKVKLPLFWALLRDFALIWFCVKVEVHLEGWRSMLEQYAWACCSLFSFPFPCRGLPTSTRQHGDLLHSSQPLHPSLTKGSLRSYSVMDSLPFWWFYNKKK